MFMRKYILLILVSLSLLLNACYYKPFIGYRINKKGFKHFSKQEKISGDNTNPERDYKVNRYDWDVEVFPEKKRIAGKMVIHFTATSNQKTFLFDLQKRMQITAFESSIGNPKISRKHDLLYLKFEENVVAKTRIKLTIQYEGKPANIAGEGPVQWKKDEKGRDWISTVTEGIGPQFIMPCNALLRAESDSSTINVTVPENLIVVSNGKLTGVIDNKTNRTKTYKHEITNPINTYSLSFNIGHFVKLTKPYVDSKGVDREIEFQVLDYHQAVADSFYNQTPHVLKVFEKIYGPYPFWSDGCKFIESTFGAMEHQSGIAMGSNYRLNWRALNGTLVHELAHEWWGNSVTGKDYCDIWMHEGMATYSEALVAEQLYGKDDYELRIKFCARSVKNTIPILKECNVLYNSWVGSADKDIYNKGALTMHSLRKVVNNDSLFFKSLYTIQRDFTKQNISTEELIARFNELLGDNYTALFDWYLKKAKPPILEFFHDKKENIIYFKWKNNIPFYADGEVVLKVGETITTLKPTIAYQSLEVTENLEPEFLVEKSIYYLVESKDKK